MGSGELLGQLVTMQTSSLWWRSISSRGGGGGRRGGGEQAGRVMLGKLDGAKYRAMSQLGLIRSLYLTKKN